MKIQKPQGRLPYIIGLVCAALAVFAAVFLPGKLSDKRADDFAAPLFNHEMPEDARLIQATAAENDDGSTNATIIMQTEWTEEEILAHYSDTTYLPAAENDEVTLQVLPLDEGSIEAVKQADLYEEEGGDYWFVYLYSAPKVTE